MRVDPADVRACLFDLDGVLTKTATVHAAAWKQMFDEYLRDERSGPGRSSCPSIRPADYGEYVDGKPRADGVRSFLASRGIELPEGRSGRSARSAETICGLGQPQERIVCR